MSDDAELLAEVVGLRKEVRQLKTRVERIDATAARSTQGLDEFEMALEELAERLTAADAGPGDVAPPSPAPGSAGAAVAPGADGGDELDPIDMDVLFDWVETNLGDWAQRKLPRTPGNAAFCWCSEWFQHPEVLTVLWALRRAWLEAVTQPGAAMAVYLRDFYYPLLRAVSDPTGPMQGCTPEHHADSRFVPVYPDDKS